MADFEVSLGLNINPFLRQLNAVRRILPRQLQPVLQQVFGAGNAQQLAQTSAAVNQFATQLRGLSNVGQDANRVFSNLGSNTKRGSRGFVESALIASRWVVAYGALFSLLRKGINTVKEFAQTVVELDTTQRKFLRILDESPTAQSDVNRLFDAGARSAYNYATNLSEVLRVQEDFLLQGRTVAETILLTNATLLGARVGFSDVVTVSKSLSATLNAIGASAGYARQVIDVLNRVSKTSAIEFDELAEAVRTSVAAGSAAGVSFLELNGIIAGIAQQTRQTGNEVGTSLRSIFAFFRRPETVRAIQDITAGLGDQRVEIERSTGTVDNWLVALAKVRLALDRVSEGMALQSIQALGSVRRQREVIAVMTNFPFILEQTVNALFATGDAMKDLEISLGGIEATATRAKVAIQAYAVQTRDSLIPAFQASARYGLNFVNGVLAAIGTNLGRLGLLSGVIAILAVKILSLGSAAGGAKVGLFSLTAATLGFQKALAGLTATFSPTIIAVLAFAAALAIILPLVGQMRQKLNQALSEAKQRAEEAATAIEQFQGTLDKVKIEKQTLEDLREIFRLATEAGDLRLPEALRNAFAKAGVEIREGKEGLEDFDALIKKLDQDEKTLEKNREDAARRAIQQNEAVLEKIESRRVELDKEVDSLRESASIASRRAAPEAVLKLIDEDLKDLSAERIRLGHEEEAIRANIVELNIRSKGLEKDAIPDLKEEESALRELGQISNSFNESLTERQILLEEIKRLGDFPGAEEAILKTAKSLNQQIQDLATKALVKVLRIQKDLGFLPDEYKILLADLREWATLRFRADAALTETEFRTKTITKLEQDRQQILEQVAQGEERITELTEVETLLADARNRKLSDQETLALKLETIRSKTLDAEQELNRVLEANASAMDILLTSSEGIFDSEEARRQTNEFLKSLTDEQSAAVRRYLFFLGLLKNTEGEIAELRQRQQKTLDEGVRQLQIRSLVASAELAGLRESQRIQVEIRALEELGIRNAEDQVRLLDLSLDRQRALSLEAQETGFAIKNSIAGALVDVATGQSNAVEGFKRLTQAVNEQVIQLQVNALLSRFDPFFQKIGKALLDSADQIHQQGNAMFIDGTKHFTTEGTRMFNTAVDALRVVFSQFTGDLGQRPLTPLPTQAQQGFGAVGSTFPPVGDGVPVTLSPTDRKRQDRNAKIAIASIQTASLLGSGRPQLGQLIGTLGSAASLFVSNPYVGLAIAVGAALVGSLLDKGGPKQQQVQTSINQIPPAISLTNQQLAEVNRNLVALRSEIRPFALPESFFFRERPTGGVIVQNLNVGSAQEARVVTQDLLRGAVGV